MAETSDFTVESAASELDGLLSGNDGEQERDEQAEQAETGDDSEGEPEEEAEESEDAEQEEEPEEEPSYTVKIDGKDATVPLKELLSGYQRTADYTRKTQELAEQRKSAASELESAKAERAHYA